MIRDMSTSNKGEAPDMGDLSDVGAEFKLFCFATIIKINSLECNG